MAYKVKILKDANPYDLEQELNEWLDEMDDSIDIVEIKYQQSVQETKDEIYTYFSALVLYK